MRLFGFEITRAKEEKAFSSVTGNRGGWLPIIRESFAGAWQQNVEIKRDLVLTHTAVFACMTLIAGDIAKLRLNLQQRDENGIWVETTNPSYSPVLRKPNSIQTRPQFWEHYFLSKLSNGNVYVLKGRDNRNVVTSMWVLDPNRVQPLVSEDGRVFYRLSTDDVSGIEDEITVPASEIIHDRFNCFFHPLIGLSPLVAAGLPAMQAMNMQTDSTNFFANRAMPGGLLLAEGAIGSETADRLKAYWEGNFQGESSGKIAVLGDNLKFTQMRINATDSQLIEQLRWTSEQICSTFHVPPFKIGLQQPTYDNVEALNIVYYQDALQALIYHAEVALSEGLSLSEGFRANFEDDDLLRMDSAAQMDVLEKSKGKLTVNEQRRRLNQTPVEGGDTVYLQEQDHSLEWLARRDAQPLPDPNATPAPPAENDNNEAEARAALIEIYKGLR